MLNKTFAAVLIITILGGTAQAAPNAFNQLGGEARFASVSVPSAKPRKWTIMVYVNAKNNLEEFGLKDVNEMETVGSGENVSIVAELGRMSGFSFDDGNWTGARRYLINKDTDTAKITSPVLASMAKADMGDYKHLIEFGQWAKAAYPAENYMLIVWNHGSGWEESPRQRAISFDSETKNHISIPQLAQALKEIGGVTIYASDACLMQMASVDYELKDYADYIIGSEETEPGDGYAYDRFLTAVNASGLTPEELGRAAVNTYAEHYAQANEGSTLSLIKTSALPGLITAVRGFTDAVRSADLKTEAKTARDTTLSFDFDNKDLAAFADHMAALTPDENVKKTAAGLRAYITQELVQLSRTTTKKDWQYTKDYSTATGLSVYLPNGRYKPAYENLRFARESGWAEFIKWTISY